MATATIDNKIKNALNMYNTGLQEILPDKFVGKVNGKDLSTNDFTDALKEKLEAFSTETQVVDASAFTDTFVTKVSGKDLSTNDFTDAYKTAIDGMSTTYAKKADMVGLYNYKGTVANFVAIPTDTTVGDVWNISVGGGVDEHGIAIKDGDNVAKTENGFDVFAGSVNLSGYVQKDGEKGLSTNDFTDAYKEKLEALSTETQVVNLTGVARFYVGPVAPTDTSVIWFDTSAYLDE